MRKKTETALETETIRREREIKRERERTRAKYNIKELRRDKHI